MWSFRKRQPPPPLPAPEPVFIKPAPAVIKPVPSGTKWITQPIDGELARVIRRGIRAKRREKGRQGHRFRYDDLRALFSMTRRDEMLVLVTHNEDKLWQVHHFDPENGWTLESWHRTLKEAQAEAEASKPKPKPKPVVVVPPTPEELPGIYLSVSWAHQPYHGTRPMTVKCSSAYTAEVISSIFEQLGCAVASNEVAAA